ncbi:MAG: hypothetical protein K6E11_04110 [Bacilli bacterium]|nr:hypothetical protein [Bacilli bacterium]
MILEVNKLVSRKPLVVDEDITFDADTYKCVLPLIDVKSCHVTMEASRYDDFVEVNIKVKADVILQSSYTLKPFNFKLNTSEEYHFSSIKEDEESDFIVYKGSIIQMDEYIFNLISASIPMSPKAPGETFKSDSGDIRFMSEEDFLKEQEKEVDHRFDKLDELEFD